MKKYIEIFEVGPRDGLQSERKVIGTEDKVKLVNFLSKCGMAKIEVSSFVSPKWVPQLADADIRALVALSWVSAVHRRRAVDEPLQPAAL